MPLIDPVAGGPVIAFKRVAQGVLIDPLGRPVRAVVESPNAILSTHSRAVVVGEETDGSILGPLGRPIVPVSIYPMGSGPVLPDGRSVTPLRILGGQPSLASYRLVEGGDRRITEAGDARVTE